MAEGVERARAVIASGQAKAKMQALVAFSQTFQAAGA
jgi:anthranilate phosphoribosyltransferase